jgi:5-hydroxyisourate hydrolase-like protein (transthyretin family)
VTAAVGTATATASIAVKAAPLRVTSIAYRLTSGRLAVTTTVANAATGAPVAGASLSLAINRGSALYASGSGTTGSDGRLTLTTSSRVPSGCYRTAVKTVTAQGFAWDGITPANQYCR